MNNKIYTLKQIRALYGENVSVKDFAELLGVDALRWQRIERYDLKMSASEFVRLLKTIEPIMKLYEFTYLDIKLE